MTPLWGLICIICFHMWFSRLFPYQFIVLYLQLVSYYYSGRLIGRSMKVIGRLDVKPQSLDQWFTLWFAHERSWMLYVQFLLTTCMVCIMIRCMCPKARVAGVLVWFGQTSGCLSLSIFLWDAMCGRYPLDHIPMCLESTNLHWCACVVSSHRIWVENHLKGGQAERAKMACYPPCTLQEFELPD